ncbi:hypothetical protein CSA56_15135 [candidate division KSB3 bacterium]|uniref:DNA mismatch repair proteins mutS family domain-containing protein n=1 Tax=candidate division KSB3 bacterium TaxID=2044937 RepID=A0A2G6KA66_9BACT|nr:MAG: hypothetical protein CSA56_15135 [candidate division KSB3 bacterium]
MTTQQRQYALERHIRRIQRSIHCLEEKRDHYSRYRPYLFFAGVGLTYWLGWLSVIMAAVLMATEVLYTNRIKKTLHRHRLWLEIKSVQLARLNLDWEHIPEPPHQPLDEQHPFEVDLDITGLRSLHHLLDTAVSREGSERLRNWLLQTPPDRKQIETRRTIIQEIISLSRFRDKLLLNFRLVSKEQLDGSKLLSWLQAQRPSDALQRVLPVAGSLAIINIILFLSFIFGKLPAYWLLSLALYLVIYFYHLPRIARYFDAAMTLYNELEKFRTILQYLETYPYKKDSSLQKLCAPFCRKDALPSVLITQVSWLMAAVGLRMNPMLGFLLNLVIPWDIVFAALTVRCQTRCARQFPQWVEVWSELEALISLANFAYLQPEYIFPDIVTDREREAGPLLQAHELGHPLLPAAQKVCNDYTINRIGDITLLTGSNMAGKSTFLKTVGINMCVAYAGGPVNATLFRTSLFRVYSCIQIHDSVNDGYSFFYAEVRRLKDILDALHQQNSYPVFFLIDEIFKGTNSRERLIGSRAYIHHLSTQSGTGLIATHDLELAQLSEHISGLRNAHFRDSVADGKMSFDYLLHRGPCPTTNALKIMKMEGLPVEISDRQSKTHTCEHP